MYPEKEEGQIHSKESCTNALKLGNSGLWNQKDPTTDIFAKIGVSSRSFQNIANLPIPVTLNRIFVITFLLDRRHSVRQLAARRELGRLYDT